jgi:UDP-2,3-diacylglucosamine pyrophosphatase LpxH
LETNLPALTRGWERSDFTAAVTEQLASKYNKRQNPRTEPQAAVVLGRSRGNGAVKILAIADEEAKYYYDYYTPGKLDEFDLILACGDLHRSYLEFLVTLAHCPVLYIHGNHDEDFERNPPEGCICIDDQLYVYKGIRILGLGGSYRYRKGTYMYTDREMANRIRKLWFPIWRNKGFDILMTHAPAYHINDFDNRTHRGFKPFVTLLDKYKPKYFIHGHIHKNYGIRIPKRTQRGDTTIINAYDYVKFDY